MCQRLLCTGTESIWRETETRGSQQRWWISVEQKWAFQSEKAVWRGVLLEILFWWCCAHVILRKSSSFAKCLPGHPAWKSVIKLKRPSGSVTSEGYLVWLYQWRLFFAIILLISGADFVFFLNSVNVIQGEGTIWAVRQEADECLPKACPLLWVCGGWLKWLYLSYRWRW